jgi:predicted nucleotidyltransferase
MNKYQDILYLARPVSKVHQPMSKSNRAAQFSPFAALAGYEDAVQETARLTTDKITLSEDQIQIINSVLNEISQYLPHSPYVQITYFEPDKRKQGGSYQHISGTIKKIDDVYGMVIMKGNIRIPVHQIVHISIEKR